MGGPLVPGLATPGGLGVRVNVRVGVLAGMDVRVDLGGRSRPVPVRVVARLETENAYRDPADRQDHALYGSGKRSPLTEVHRPDATSPANFLMSTGSHLPVGTGTSPLPTISSFQSAASVPSRFRWPARK